MAPAALMPGLFLVFLMLVAIAVVVRAPLRTGLGVLLGVTMLVPDTLRFPATSSYLTFHRLVLVGFVANLAYGFLRHRLDVELLRPTRVHLALLGFVVVAFVIGVGLGEPKVPIVVSVFLWTTFLDSLIFFAALVVAIRAISNPSWVARLVVAFTAIAAAIAIAEHFTRWSYGQWLFSDLRSLGFLPGSHGLETRGGDVRVRASAQFSLAYAWIAAALTPLVVMVASRLRRIVLSAALPALVVASIVWTYSRSVYAGLVLGALVLLVASRVDVRASLLVGTGAIAMFLVIGGSLLFFRTFRGPDVPGSDVTREERLPVVLEAAAERPFTGLGLVALDRLGFAGTDASYMHLYVELGVAGLVAFVIVIGVAAATVAPAIRAPPGTVRTLGAAVLAGLGVAVLGGAFFDTFTIPGSARTFWLLAAFGVVLAERVAEPAGAIRRRPRAALRVAVPLIGAGVGFLVLMLAPTGAAVTARFTTFSASQQARSGGSQDFIGRALVASACTAIEATGASTGADIECFDLRTSDGVGEARIRSATRETAERSARVAMRAGLAAVRSVHVYAVGETRIVRPTWARTAPLWGCGAGLLLAVTIPPLAPVARRRSTTAVVAM